jgi:hypothetical protein
VTVTGVTPQKVDSLVRTVTTSLIAVTLIVAVVYLAVTVREGPLTSLQAGLFGWAGVVVGFYFGGHVAQNTAALEEARQIKATDAAEASALRSEAAAPRTQR